MTGALLVIGDVVTDVVALHDRPLAPHTDTAARIAVLPGGSAANSAAWAAYSGAEVRLLSRLGADSADWHRAELVGAGVRPHLVVDPELSTAVVICLVDAEAERTFVTDTGAAARLGPADWDPALLDGVARLHLSGYLYFTDQGRQLAVRAVAAAEARGLPVSVDPASTGFIERLGVADFLAAIDGTDLLLPNSAEARLLAGTDDPVTAAERLSAVYGEAVVKLGPQGAVAAREGKVVARIAAVPSTALDTTGAGDAFTGAFLAARLGGADLAEATAAGCGAGAAAVARTGGRPPAR
ncbi:MULTISPECIES: carbohydrate kinase family protein [unclassified Kitasatospora]|uniref:carbohydrate kinase family protein n=1 Tax=unclassified Kitasatospora TaxID=2633591 RepID=UPI00070C9EFA|nr:MULTISPECIES: PfkB family carbohydrate kinase [unclassified Kitasatospora]KQV05641.1 sugar kinase [Kitasatospora sp. Root107]KRB62445.1 sugar kinase [Kitasatospora sp. Root187]